MAEVSGADDLVELGGVNPIAPFILIGERLLGIARAHPIVGVLRFVRFGSFGADFGRGFLAVLALRFAQLGLAGLRLGSCFRAFAAFLVFRFAFGVLRAFGLAFIAKIVSQLQIAQDGAGELRERLLVAH